ncbi:sensor histidine kinase [Cohnella rhizosphaerae]|uniref:ATP-binding protein n=1 Tax=Cohnella rhizosphaerae TaxID=1457232 RepID=A0A9X4KRM4_9BACL|nr:ATP-binding protein [Cohnella rhizosphaerae]MDG0809854.1 ATP-binding protein [Cohnella rhizosphaerae]
MRFPDLLHYSVDMPEDLLAQEVPPLIVQTMVENAIKYAVNMDEPIRITVEVAQAEDGEGHPRLFIRVKDTGPGFPDEVLGRLASEPDQAGSEGGEQIGIWNARRRLRLLYQDRATIDFYNEAGLGAVVQIELPMDKKAR